MPQIKQLVPWILMAALGACGPSDSNGNENDNENQNQTLDAGLDAAPGDAAPGDASPGDASPGDAATPDAGTNLVWDAGGTTSWQVKAINNLLLEETPLLAAHPTATSTLAALPPATETHNVMAVYRTTDGMTWLPVTAYTFTASAGFFGTPKGLAWDPRSGDDLVAAMEPVPAPNSGLAMILAWSADGGDTYDHPWNPWASPWPPDEMHYVDGNPSALVWRAGANFFYETAHGSAFTRTETLDPLPASCGAIAMFDVPRNDHDAVAIGCATNGGAHLCDVTTDLCTAVPVVGPIRDVAYGPLDPLVLYVLTSDRIHRSSDAGATFDEVHTFSADVVKVAPNNSDTACALHRTSGALRCTRDDGLTWMDLTPPDLQGPTATRVLDIAFTADGHLWAIAHPGVIYLGAP